MQLVRSLEEIESNIDTLAEYLAHPRSPNGEFAYDLISRGICFVAATRDGASFFTPSRFIGYAQNSRTPHIANLDKDGRATNPAISRVLGSKPELNEELERMYLEFCSRIGIEKQPTGSFGRRRKFWRL